MVSIKYRRGRWNFNPKFGVKLRIDDYRILSWMQTYFGCGRCTTATKRKSPAAAFVVADLYSLLSRVVPHFEAYPLRAKKREDYVIWKKMLLLQSSRFRQPWDVEIRRKMQRLYTQLKNIRRLFGSNLLD